MPFPAVVRDHVLRGNYSVLSSLNIDQLIGQSGVDVDALTVKLLVGVECEAISLEMVGQDAFFNYFLSQVFAGHRNHIGSVCTDQHPLYKPQNPWSFAWDSTSEERESKIELNFPTRPRSVDDTDEQFNEYIQTMTSAILEQLTLPDSMGDVIAPVQNRTVGDLWPGEVSTYFNDHVSIRAAIACCIQFLQTGSNMRAAYTGLVDYRNHIVATRGQANNITLVAPVNFTGAGSMFEPSSSPQSIPASGFDASATPWTQTQRR